MRNSATARLGGLRYNRPMKFSLAIYAPPSSEASFSAYQFTRASLAQQHEIYRIFFYHDAVYQSSNLICTPQGEFDLNAAWQDLQSQHQLDIVVCIAASLRRGLINEEEAQRYEKKHSNLSEHFELSGLGQLVDASIVSDRLITFGG